jgi:hypothetical protein
MLFGLQKGLEGQYQGRMFPLPFDSWAAGQNRSVRRIKDRKQLFLGWDLLEIPE